MYNKESYIRNWVLGRIVLKYKNKGEVFLKLMNYIIYKYTFN